MAEILANGLKTNYIRFGEGPHRAVFIHGLVVDDLSSWFFTLAGLAATRREILLYDLRGHGKTDRPATGYGIPDMIADLEGLLGALGWKDQPADVIGNSHGGLLALVFASCYPGLVRTLFLIDPHLPDQTWSEQMRRTLTLQGEERDRRIAHAFRRWPYSGSDPRTSRLADRARNLVYNTSLVKDLDRAPVFSPKEYGRIRCPVLAIYGGESEIRSCGERLRSVLPDCTLEIVPGCSHSVLFERTEWLRERLAAWLGPASEGEGKAQV